MDRVVASATALDAHRRMNQTTVPYPADSSVNELFDRCVARFPAAVAVIHRDRSVSYRELDELAAGLAARLYARGARLGGVVGVCVERSPEMIAALLAVLRCGAAYLPFDASWPDERLCGLFDQTGCELMVTDQPEALAERFRGCRVVSVDGIEPLIGDCSAVSGTPDARVGPETIAYINFTSGSTGQPKGVQIRHRGIARLVFNASYARLDENSTLLQLAPVAFDAATFEIWGALLRGGTCVLYPSPLVRFSEMRRTLEKHGVTVLFLTTALFNSIVDEAPETLDVVETILTGGEEHSLRHVGKALRRYGPDRLTSVYGPTECTTFATSYPVRGIRPDENALPIGRPIQNTRAYVVDDDRLCAVGETGEVLLAGPGLSPGYVGLPEATAERFIEREIGPAVERLYRTGDRAFLRDDGVLVFQGRLDDQVKINGYRIELGEVSHHLDRLPGVRQNFVTVRENAAGEKVLVAFIVAEHEHCTATMVRGHLGRLIPPYMVPSEILFREFLPLSSTGKIDRQLLLSSLPSARERMARAHR